MAKKKTDKKVNKKTKEELEDLEVKLGKDLKKVANLFSRKTKKDVKDVTRDFYRKQGKYREKDYTEVYGSFPNFKEKVFFDEYFFNRESIVSSQDDTPKKGVRRYFVTSAIEGQSLDQNFYKAVKSYCKINNAQLIILACRGVHKIKDSKLGYPEELFEDKSVFFFEYKFCKTLTAYDLMTYPQHKLPLSAGTDRLTHSGSSAIIASPKQHFVSVPVPNERPRLMYSTGVITLPDSYAYTKSGGLAKLDHVIGGLIVEIDAKDRPYIRAVQTKEKNGSFIDLGIQYFENGTVCNVEAEAIYAGDLHSGWVSDVARQDIFEQINLLKPRHIFMGDCFDGASVSHHIDYDMILKVKRPLHLQTLENELHHLGQELTTWQKSIPKGTKLCLIEGNHENFLTRYLTENRFMRDAINYELATELMIHCLRGKNPIEEWIKVEYPDLKSMYWLDRESSHKVNGIELAKHGDKGSNGAYGAPHNLEKALGKCVVGHAHTPTVLREVYVVGTLSRFDLPYTKDSVASSWLHANCVIYPNGQRQMLISYRSGGWRLK